MDIREICNTFNAKIDLRASMYEPCSCFYCLCIMPTLAKCVLSPLIFAIVVDLIMSRAAGENTLVLKWLDGE